jgi:hypothetical protein
MRWYVYRLGLGSRTFLCMAEAPTLHEAEADIRRRFRFNQPRARLRFEEART